MFFAVGGHYEDIMVEAQMRQGILSKAANTTRGSEARALKVAQDAVTNSILRFPLTVTGPWPLQIPCDV